MRVAPAGANAAADKAPGNGAKLLRVEIAQVDDIHEKQNSTSFRGALTAPSRNPWPLTLQLTVERAYLDLL